MQKPKNRWEGGPLVAHARELYTANVFGHFVELKDRSEFYYCTAVENGKEYVVEHYDLQRIQRWWKGRYRVVFTEDGCNYECECGLYEHFGLPCSHILRVSVFLSRIVDALACVL